ncbi:MAG: enoyl-CoA hydratase/isomerase family protein [Bacteroidota bacterium]
MSEYQYLILEREGAVARIRLNRPEVHNALSPQLVSELNAAVYDVSIHPEIKVLIVSGVGKSFSAGVDLQALSEGIKGGLFEANQILDDGNDLINTLQSMPQVTIAQVHGHCYTGATEFMLAFDLIYCADNANIGDTHTKWGILPKWGMSQRLSRQVGMRKAMELSFTAKPVKGTEAARIGLVNQAFPAEELEASINGIAEQICSNSAQTIAAMKTLYYEGWRNTLNHGIQYEAEFQTAITDREEFLRNFKKNK